MSYLLSCPNCDAVESVGPAKAGDAITCSRCGERIAVPKLGELRQLPEAGTADTGAAADQVPGSPAAAGNSLGFLAAGIVAVGLLLAAAFCGVRWLTVDVPATTQTHLEFFEEAYEAATPAQMVGEFEEMTATGLNLPKMYNYRTAEIERAGWQRKTLVFTGLGVLCIGIAAILRPRRSRTPNPAAASAS